MMKSMLFQKTSFEKVLLFYIALGYVLMYRIEKEE